MKKHKNPTGPQPFGTSLKSTIIINQKAFSIKSAVAHQAHPTPTKIILTYNDPAGASAKTKAEIATLNHITQKCPLLSTTISNIILSMYLINHSEIKP